MIQVAATFNQLKLSENEFNVVAVYGGDSIERQTNMLSNGADVLVATPGRLIDFIGRGKVKFHDLKCVVLD